MTSLLLKPTQPVTGHPMEASPNTQESLNLLANLLQGGSPQSDPSQGDQSQDPTSEPLPPVSTATEPQEPQAQASKTQESETQESEWVKPNLSQEPKSQESETQESGWVKPKLSQELLTELEPLSQEHPLWDSFKRAVWNATKDAGSAVASGEIITAPVHGVVRGANELIETAASTGDWLNEQIGVVIPGYEQLLDVIPDSHVTLPNLQAPETTTGKLLSGAGEFLAPYGVASKALKAWNAFSSLGKWAVASRTMAAGALVDALAFDPYEERLSNLGAEYGPEIFKPIFNFLKSDASDSELEGRLKNALEGAGLGLALDGTIKLIKLMKRGLTHQKRVSQLTGSAYRPDPDMSKQIQELAYWQEHVAVNDELVSHSKLPDNELPREGAIFHGTNLADAALDKSEEYWLHVLQSEAWTQLPEAARQDLESLLRHRGIQQDALTSHAKDIIEADKLKRQEQVNARADDALGFEPHATRPQGSQPQGTESFVDKEEMRRLLKDVGREREDVHHHLWGRRINFDYIKTNDDVYKLIDEIQDVYTSELNAHRGKNRSFDETKDLAETLGLSSADKMKENLQRLFSTTEVLDAQVHGARTYVNALFAHLQDLA